MKNSPLCLLLLMRDRSEIDQVKALIEKIRPNNLYVITQEEEFKQRIDWLDYDLIICGSNLPVCQAQKLSLLSHIKCPQIPFVSIIESPDELANLWQADFSMNTIVRHEAVLIRSKLSKSINLLKSVYLKSVAGLESQKVYLKKIRRRALLLQKFEALWEGISSDKKNKETINKISKQLFG